MTSPVAHARIETARHRTRRGRARRAWRCYTASDLPTVPIHEIARIPESFAQPALADGEVRFVGEYVVAIVAETAAAAVDAAELVDVEYSPLPVVIDARDIERRRALVGRTGGRRRVRGRGGHRAGSRTASLASRWRPWRGAASSRFRPEHRRRSHACTRRRRHRTGRAPSSRALARRPVRAPAGDHAARRWRLRREGGRRGRGVCGRGRGGAATRHAVRYVEPRNDNLVTMQGRGLYFDVALHARRDGTIVGLEVDECCDAARTPRRARSSPARPASWRVAPTACRPSPSAARSVRTNLAPTGAYRGPGRSEAAAALERTVDLLARDLDLDPAVVRARNLVTAAELPTESPTGAHYDDGDFPALLDQLLEHTDYRALREEQARRRARHDPRVLGLGIATVVDSTGMVRARRRPRACTVLADGTVRVLTGTASGRAAARPRVRDAGGRSAPGDDRRRRGGRRRHRHRRGQRGHVGLAVVAARGQRRARRRRRRARAGPAARRRSPRSRGRRHRGRRTSSSSCAACRRAASPSPNSPRTSTTRSSTTARSTPAACSTRRTRPTRAAAHLSVVEVDLDTGSVTPLQPLRGHRLRAGRRIRRRPTGQVVGASAQGIGQALFEEFVYDDARQPAHEQPRRVPRPECERAPGDRRPLHDDPGDARTRSAHEVSAK